MKLAILFSGGKDSVYSAWLAKKYKHELTCLISIHSKNKESYMFHTPSISQVEFQAKSMNLPIIIQETSGKKEIELKDLKKVILKTKKQYNIQGVVTGAIQSVYQSSRIQKICNKLQLECFNPLWQKNEFEYLNELIKNKFEVILTGVFAYPLDKSWLGKKIDKNFVKEIYKLNKKYKIHPAGEGGEFETFVTLEELKAVTGDPKIRYKIIDSYQFIANVNCAYPFREFLSEQYDKRMKLKEEKNPLERAIKIILNSMYGKTAQRVNNQMGNLFNPVIASFITGFARAQLYKFVKDNTLENDVVAFATDSIACRKKIADLNSSKLGEMKLDKSASDVYFLSNGFYRFNEVWKNRGIGYDSEKKVEIEHQDTQIGKDGQLYISVKTTKTTHIKSGIIYNKLDKIGVIEEYEKKIGLNSDRKRFWHSELKSLKEETFCDSSAIPIDVVGDIISEKEIEWNDEEYYPESES